MSRILDPRQLLERYEKEVWFSRPFARKHVISQLATMVAKLEKKGGMLGFKTEVRVFDEAMEEYVLIITRYVTYQVKKDPTLKRQLFAATSRAEDRDEEQEHSGGAGADLWIADPYGEDPSSQQEFNALPEHEKRACVWLQSFTRDLLLFKCKEVFDTAIVAEVKKVLMDTTQENITWTSIIRMIRLRLPDHDPQTLLESLISMRRPSGMPAIEWTNSFLIADCTQAGARKGWNHVG